MRGLSWRKRWPRRGGVLGWRKLFPVEGDSAVAELRFDEATWAEIWLENIQLNQVGGDRTEGARVRIRLSSLPEPVGLDDLLELIEEARTWLIKNERGRVPLEFDE
jgi:hypothetical protein